MPLGWGDLIYGIIVAVAIIGLVAEIRDRRNGKMDDVDELVSRRRQDFNTGRKRANGG